MKIETHERLLSLSTPLLVDARHRLGLPETHLDPGIKPVVPFTTMAGSAVTVLLEPAEDEASADLSLLLDGYASGTGDARVMVIQVPPELHSRGIFGGGAATMARAHGFVGALIEGAVRDSHDLREMKFPAFSRTVSPGYIVGKVSAVALNDPVTIGGRTIRGDDAIVGDNDGVVVIGPDELDEVIARAFAIEEWEHRMHALQAKGATVADAIDSAGPMP